MVWLARPQSNELNRCDGGAAVEGCFWFYAMQYFTNDHNSGIHIGPQRGDSLAGLAGGNWRMNIDGYNDGQHVGGQSSVNLPTATWIRVRTWRITSGRDADGRWARFGVWAQWSGTDRYLGSVTIDGTWITNSSMFTEVWEGDGQCSTDLEPGYLLRPTYQRKATFSTFRNAIVDYESNCPDTSWSVVGAPDFVSDARERARTIPGGAMAWERVHQDYAWDALPQTRGGNDLKVRLSGHAWVGQPFVPTRSALDRITFVGSCDGCAADVRISTDRAGTQGVCAARNLTVQADKATSAIFVNCSLTPGRRYYAQVVNLSSAVPLTVYLVDATGGPSSEFAYRSSGSMPSATALRSGVWTRYP